MTFNMVNHMLLTEGIRESESVLYDVEREAVACELINNE